jgi:hypothetical protein
MKSISAAGLAACIVTVAVTVPAHADITLLDLHWQFYQGGYVQDPADNWAVFQNHYDRNPELNVVTHTIGGATFESVASMDVNVTDKTGFYQLSALNQLSVSASVAETSPQGLAHAFAALSQFIVRFALDETYMYTGSETLRNNYGTEFVSGSVLAPGEYGFWHISPFGPPLVETAFVGPGQSDTASDTWHLLFEFNAVPAPAGIWLVAAGLLPMRRRRQR